MNARTVITWLALLVFGVAANFCQAEDQPDTREPAAAKSSRDELSYTPPEWPDPPDTAAMLRRVVVGTAIVLVLCVGTLWAGKRWLRGAPAGTGSGNALRLVESVSLGNRCAVHLLRTGEHQVLVGVDAAGLKSLVALPPSFENAIAEAGSPTFDSPEIERSV